MPRSGRAAHLVLITYLATLPLIYAGSCSSTSNETEAGLHLLQTDLTLENAEVAAHVQQSQGNSTKPVSEAVDGGTHTRHQKTSPKVAPAEETEDQANTSHDLAAFLVAVITVSVLIMIGILMFGKFRRWYPEIYSYNIMQGTAPLRPQGTIFGWARASLSLTTEQVHSYLGLDSALLINFTGICNRIMVRLFVPLVLILAPLHALCGGITDSDVLSTFSIHRVKQDSWLLWVHAFLVWVVCYIVQSQAYEAMRKFVDNYRYKWISSMPDPRATTILVEHIPEAYRCDDALKEFFQEMFTASKVKTAYVVKDVQVLTNAYARKKEAENKKYVALKKWEVEYDKEPSKAPTEIVDYYEKQLSESEKIIEAEMTRIEGLYKTPGGINCSTGFVTFKNKETANRALHLEYSCHSKEWMVSRPPDPQSILWGDLIQKDSVSLGKRYYQSLGNLAIVGMFIGYCPLVVGITNVAESTHLGPIFQALWKGFAPSVGLTLVVSLVPTFLLTIFRTFYIFNGSAQSQKSLQNCYFWFELIFVVFITAIGQDFWAFMTSIIKEPWQTPLTIAETMPYATHFYMNYVVIQWITESLSLFRWVVLSRYKIFSLIYDSAEAKQMSEPEDQDHNGMGARSTRLATIMIIGIVFSTICPPICILVLVYFMVCRLTYGYLLPFAETKKVDLGGLFFVTQLEQLFCGNFVYCLLMTGVLNVRCTSSQGPSIIAGLSLLYVAVSFMRFKTAFYWQDIPYPALVDAEEHRKVQKEGQYVQPELMAGSGKLANLYARTAEN